MQRNIKNWLVKNQLLIKIVFFLYFSVLTWLLLKPGGGSSILSKIYYNDKLVHTLTFLVLTFLAILAFSRIKKSIFVVLFSLFGVLIEYLQEYLGWGRTFEYLDMLADFSGCILGAISATLVTNKIKALD